MAHCCNETFEEKTRWVSSQVVGESTAQTVTTKSIAFMLDIPSLFPNRITQRATATSDVWFHYTVKRRNLGRSATALKIDAKYQPGLMAVEIDEIKAGN
jgi:hypothetical protein